MPPAKAKAKVEEKPNGVPDRANYVILDGKLLCQTPYGNKAQILDVRNYAWLGTAPQYHDTNFHNPNFPNLYQLKETDLVLLYPGLASEQTIRWDGTIEDFLNYIYEGLELVDVGGEADQES
jgi:hypothetical protein